MENSSGKTQNKALYTLITVFFFWGFVAASNSVLIPFFKKNFELSQSQSQLVDSAFYIAYTIGALLYFLISVTAGDPLNKIGYKKGLIIGLLISALGTLGFIPAALTGSYALMLTSLFVIALGFTLQQIVANPYVIAVGDPSTGAHRVSFAGSINSIGTMIGPLILSYAIFGDVNSKNVNVGLEVLPTPYLFLGAAFVLAAIILGLSKLPPITNNEKIESGLGALKYPQLILGMIAIFAYVGVEVAIQSNLPALMEQKDFLGLPHTQTVHFISLYWGSLMIGRFTQSISVFKLSKQGRTIAMIVVPIFAYGLILGANRINNSPMDDLYYYFPCVLGLIAAFFMGQEKPARTLLIFALCGMALMGVGLVFHGKIALYAFISGGLFCSIMWPCIFSLSIAGLGKYTSQGSSLLVMMILGGACIPYLQGLICDMAKSDPAGMFGRTWIHLSYVLPVLCFAYLAFYAWKVKGILKTQGIDYEAGVEATH